MARERWVGVYQGIGLVGNLAKKQSADLLCSWQAWEREPDSPADTELPCGDFVQCVWACGETEDQKEKIDSGCGDLLKLCVCFCAESMRICDYHGQVSHSNTDSQRKFSLNSCLMNHGKCGQRWVFYKLSHLFCAWEIEAGPFRDNPSRLAS